jgi:hypothetical protein
MGIAEWGMGGAESWDCGVVGSRPSHKATAWQATERRATVVTGWRAKRSLFQSLNDQPSTRGRAVL